MVGFNDDNTNRGKNLMLDAELFWVVAFPLLIQVVLSQNHSGLGTWSFCTTPHNCSGEVKSRLSARAKQMVHYSSGRLSLTGGRVMSCQQKSSPIHSPERQQWAKCRLRQCSFTQQLAPDQQVCTQHTTVEQLVGKSSQDQSLRGNPGPLCWLVFCCSTCLSPKHFDGTAPLFWKQIYLWQFPGYSGL